MVCRGIQIIKNISIIKGNNNQWNNLNLINIFCWSLARIYPCIIIFQLNLIVVISSMLINWSPDSSPNCDWLDIILFIKLPILYLIQKQPFIHWQNVEGEVYSVNDRMMEILDDLEAHPTFYTRTQIPIIFQEKSEKMWCYLMQNFRQDVLQLPMNSRYDVKAHGTYVGRANRPPGKEEAMAYRAEIKENAWR